MLYHFHEMHRSMITPLTQWAEASAKLFTNPVSPFAHAPFAQRIAAGYELLYRLGKEYEKPAFDLNKTLVTGGKWVTVTEVATEKTFSWFENTVIYSVPQNFPAFGRKVYPGFLQHAGFVAMNPGRHAQSHREFYQHLIEGDDESAEEHRKFYDEYNAVL